MPKGTILFNPAAGRFPAGRLLKAVSERFEQKGWEITIQIAPTSDELERMAGLSARRGDDALLVAGGDGSVGRAAQSLAGSNTALGVLPSGTANVWAKELGLRGLGWTHFNSLIEAAERLAVGRIRSADIGVCGVHQFLLWAGIGLDAEVVQSAEPRGRWKRFFALPHYSYLLIKKSVGWKGIRLRIVSSEMEFEDQFIFVVASNIRSYAGGYVELSRDARVDDGKLDFWFFKGSSFRSALIHAINMVGTRHRDSQDVVHFQSTDIHVDSDSEFVMQFDGEPQVMKPPIQISLRRKILRVLVPSGVEIPIFSEEEGEPVYL